MSVLGAGSADVTAMQVEPTRTLADRGSSMREPPPAPPLMLHTDRRRSFPPPPPDGSTVTVTSSASVVVHRYELEPSWTSDEPTVNVPTTSRDARTRSGSL